MKKFDKGYIYYSLITSLASAAVILLLFSDAIFDDTLWASGSGLWALLGIYLVCYGASVVWSILFVRSSGYELTDTEIRCRKGVIGRKTSVLAYPKIHAVNKKQNLLHKLVGIAVLTVDSGATANAFSAEITIIEKAAEVDRLMALIRCRQEGEEVPAPEAVPAKENLYRFNSRLKWIYTALTVGASVLSMVVLAAFALAGLGIAAAIWRNSVSFSGSEILIFMLILAGVALFVVSVISLIGGIITSYVGYHDFRVHKNRNDIQISYGMFVCHTNDFKFSRIKAVKIMEGPVKRLFGFATAGLEVVGYGSATSGDDSNNEQSGAPGMLLPLCRKKDLPAILERILPGYVPDPIAHRAKSFWAFVLWPAFWMGLGFGIGAVAILTVMLMLGAPVQTALSVLGILAGGLLLALLALMITAMLQYFNAGLAIGDGKLTIQNGGLIRRRTVIRRKDIIAIEASTTPMRRKKGICSYKIHFFSNALTNTVTVQNLDAALAAQLEAMLKD